MRTDNLRQYVHLRNELTNERNAIEARLRQLDEALSEVTAMRSERIRVQTGPGRRSAGGISLKNLVIEVLSVGPKTKEEVLEEVQRRGYKFSTNNPLNSLGVILYGKNPKFNRVDGRFSVGPGVLLTPKTSGRGKRQMSAAGRARIAAAQRKRWAASRKDEPKGTSPSGAAEPARRKLSPAARKKIAEAARRWAAAKAAGKRKL